MAGPNGHKVVRALSVTMKPYAICQGKSTEPDQLCEHGWEWPKGPMDAYMDARQMAKGHVKLTGHEVVVVTEKKDLYVPDD